MYFMSEGDLELLVLVAQEEIIEEAAELVDAITETMVEACKANDKALKHVVKEHEAEINGLLERLEDADTEIDKLHKYITLLERLLGRTAE